MARIEPFAGIRYDTSVVVLDDVVAPPYDVVDEVQRAELAARSRYNSILVELPEPDEEAGLDRYANAARIFDEWLEGGALVTDPEAAFYVHRMRFEDDAGSKRATTGVIGALALDPDGGGDVLPHEQTMPKPKSDRLDLLRATRTNLSPIWGLSLASGLAKACSEAVLDLEPARAVVDGVTHELWSVTGADFIDEVRTLLAGAPVLIADGHHRYDTACAYQAERRAGGSVAVADHDFVMALVVELTEEELSVQPIHRLVSGLPEGFDLAGALARYFEVERSPGDAGALAAAATERGAIGMITPEGEWLLTPLPATEEAAAEPLDSSRLEVAFASLPPHELAYQHGRAEAVGKLASGDAQAVFLVRPAPVARISDTARGGRLMPPKTTFFTPKPRTGMVFRRLAE